MNNTIKINNCNRLELNTTPNIFEGLNYFKLEYFDMNKSLVNIYLTIENCCSIYSTLYSIIKHIDSNKSYNNTINTISRINLYSLIFIREINKNYFILTIKNTVITTCKEFPDINIHINNTSIFTLHNIFENFILEYQNICNKKILH